MADPPVPPPRRIVWLPQIPLETADAPPRPRVHHLPLISDLDRADQFQPPPQATKPAGWPAVLTPGMVSKPRAVAAPDTPNNAALAIAGFDGLAWAGRLPANGNREATILIPRGTDLGKPVELMVFFHGNGGYAASYTKWFKPYIRQLPQHGRNTIVVLPTAGKGNRSMDPKQGESLTALQDQALALAEQVAGMPIRVGSYTVAGFSGGGQPIALAADAGQLRAQRINLFDSTYGDWGDRAVRRRQQGAVVNVFYTEHNRQRAERLRGLPGVHVEASPTDHGGTPVHYFYS